MHVRAVENVLGLLLLFVFSGAIPSVTDAFYETVSGFTTTGSTILKDVETLSHGLLL